MQIVIFLKLYQLDRFLRQILPAKQSNSSINLAPTDKLVTVTLQPQPMVGMMKNYFRLLAMISALGTVLFAQGCSLFKDKYAIEHKEQNKNAWLEKKHGYRDLANYESEKWEERNSTK